MNRLTRRMLAGAAFLTATSVPALAADLYMPPIVESPPSKVVYSDVSHGGWYLRGDIDYHWSKMKGADYITYSVDECCTPVAGEGSFDSTKLKGALSLGVGVGYQINNYLRADITGDYWFKSQFRGQTFGTCPGGVPCSSDDRSNFSALLMLANAYADLGTYKRITPYVGAGIGGAHVKWDDLHNTINGRTDVHKGVKEMRFAWALMAGASYCISDNVKADLGYRFSRISGGRMFEQTTPSGANLNVGPGFHKAINTHEVRAGLRYQFGGSSCDGVKHVAYEPPIYEPPQKVHVPYYK